MTVDAACRPAAVGIAGGQGIRGPGSGIRN
jgi:hypothetical protein